jgi:glycosyltransferase involved in cell wall biosynthesis
MKMCQAFAKNQHEVLLYALTSEEQIEDVYAYYGVEKCFNIQRISPKKILNNQLPDIFYGRDDLKNLLKAASTGRPVILEVHCPPKDRTAKYLTEKLLLRKNFKRLVVISDALSKEYLRLFPALKKEKIIVAHDGADLPKILVPQDKNFKLLGRNIKPKVGYIGHLYPGKGMEMILNISRHLPDLDFHVVGGTEEDIEHWRTSIDTNNIYFYGFVSHGLLRDYYNAFDIMLAPYQYKVSTFAGKGNISKWMSPLKIFEYMAHSKAIIASDLPVLKEVLCDGVNSLLCPPEDVKAWVEALLKLINKRELKENLAHNAYNEFIAKYTWRKRAEKVIM